MFCFLLFSALSYLFPFHQRIAQSCTVYIYIPFRLVFTFLSAINLPPKRTNAAGFLSMSSPNLFILFFLQGWVQRHLLYEFKKKKGGFTVLALARANDERMLRL